MLTEQQRPIIRSAYEEIRDHIFVDDVVRANLDILKRGDNQIFHISSGIGYSLKQLFKTVAYMLNIDIEPVYLSGALAEPEAIILNNTYAQRVLGWYPKIGLAEGIQLAIERLGRDREQPQSLLEWGTVKKPAQVVSLLMGA
jgi:UDP-glucose 4-epimerase